MRILLVSLLLVISSGVNAQGKKELQSLEPKFQRILEDFKVPGFAVALVKGDEIIYAKGFGFRNIEKKLPMDENTLLAVGSTTKAFTSALLGQLREDGKLEFDDRPAEYIPELRFFNEELNEKVTIRDLMSHQTGIPRHDGSWRLFPTKHKDSLIRRIAHHEPFTPLRNKWRYNNFMFLVQGVITERITGKSWEENMQDHLLTPLEMSRTTLSIDEMQKKENIATGYELKNQGMLVDVPYFHLEGLSPAGSINSSVTDMAKWIQVWLNKGKINGMQILPEIYVKEAMSSHAVVNNGFPEEDLQDIFISNYGYGWNISSYRGIYRVQHAGHIDGFSALVALYPTQQLGLVVLTNKSRASIPNLVRNLVADKMMNLPTFDWDNYYKKLVNERNALMNNIEMSTKNEVSVNTALNHSLDFYKGSYFNSGYGRFQVATDSDSLYAYFPRKKFYLKPLFEDVFEAHEIKKNYVDTMTTSAHRINFRIGMNGKISSAEIDLEPSLNKMIEFEYRPPIYEMDAKQLTLYEGEYHTGDESFHISVKDDEKLVIAIPGQFEDEIKPLGNHLFWDPIDKWQIEFKSNDNGAIQEMIIRLPDGQALKGVRK